MGNNDCAAEKSVLKSYTKRQSNVSGLNGLRQ